MNGALSGNTKRLLGKLKPPLPNSMPKKLKLVPLLDPEMRNTYFHVINWGLLPTL